MAKKRKKAKRRAAPRARRRSRRASAPRAPARRRSSARRKPVRRRRRSNVGGSFTKRATTAATTAGALGVTALLVSGFGNRLLSGMFATPLTRAAGKAAVAIGAGFLLYRFKARKAAGVVMTAGIAASVMEATAALAGPQIDAVMQKVPALKGITGGATGAAPAVSGVGQRYLQMTPPPDPVFKRPF